MRGILIASLAMLAACGAEAPQKAAEEPEEAADTRPELWKGARRGMTLAEVRAVLPQAIDDPAPDRLANGARSLLTVPNHDLGGRAFDADLYFGAHGELVQVLAVWKSPRPGCAGLDRSTEETVEVLRKRYGREVMLDIDRDGGGYHARGDWLADGINVALAAICFDPADQAMLTVAYQTRLADAAGRF